MARSPWPCNSAGGAWNLLLAPPWKPPFSQGCFQPILTHLWLCCCRFQGSVVAPRRPWAGPQPAQLQHSCLAEAAPSPAPLLMSELLMPSGLGFM